MNNTIISDIDGTIFKHQGKLTDMVLKPAIPLPEVVEKINKWYYDGDIIIFTTARPEKYRWETERQLKDAGIPYHCIVFDCNTGVRYLLNDIKPAGYRSDEESYDEDFITAVAIPLKRDEGFTNVQI